MEIIIGNKTISEVNPPYFVADIAANHDGNIKRAFKLIELAKEAGADAAKFQNFKARTIVSQKGFDTMEKLSHQSDWEKSIYEVYDEASISDDWTGLLKEKCDEIGIEYITSPYDMSAVDTCDPYLRAYKIGSGDITWPEIIKYIAKQGKPVMLATGASNLADVERAFKIISQYNNQIILMQCNTNYTASTENFKYINLNVLKTYKSMFPNCILGLSDHTFGHITVLGALALGARVFEKHFTDDNNRAGPDHKFSMNPVSWRQMVDAANILFDSLGDGQKRIEANEKDSAIIQRRALYIIRDMKKGEIINEKDLFPLRPIRADAIPPYEKEKIIGKKLSCDLKADSYLQWKVIEE